MSFPPHLPSYCPTLLHRGKLAGKNADLITSSNFWWLCGVTLSHYKARGLQNWWKHFKTVSKLQQHIYYPVPKPLFLANFWILRSKSVKVIVCLQLDCRYAWELSFQRAKVSPTAFILQEKTNIVHSKNKKSGSSKGSQNIFTIAGNFWEALQLQFLYKHSTLKL